MCSTVRFCIQTSLLVLPLALAVPAQVLFAPATYPASFPSQTTSLTSRVVAPVDLDGDGDMDLICGQDNGCLSGSPGCGLWDPDDPGGLVLRSNDGMTNLLPPIHIGAGAWSGHGVAVADLDRDGDPDVLSLGRQNGIGGAGAMFCVLTNDGVGNLAAPVTQGVPTWVSHMMVGDFDGDGNPDAALHGTIGVQTHVRLMFGDGAGGMAPGPQIQLTTIASHGIAGDLEGDGKDEIMLASGLGVLVLSTSATGFPATATFPVGALGAPHRLALGDWNADGAPDIATLFSVLGANELWTLTNNGSGTSPALSSVPLPTGIGQLQSICTFDADGDGDDDLATGWVGPSSSVGKILVNDSGTFSAAAVSVPLGDGPDLMTLADGAGSLSHLVSADRQSMTLTMVLNQSARVDVIGTPTIGAPLQLRFMSPTDAGLAYQAALSTATTPPVQIGDGRIIHLALSPILSYSMMPMQPHFSGFSGTLDATGVASGTVSVPNDPNLVGLQFYLAFLALDPNAPSGIRHISGPRSASL